MCRKCEQFSPFLQSSFIAGKGREERCGDAVSSLGCSAEEAQQQSRICASQPAVFPVSFLPPDTPDRLCWGDAGSGVLQLAVWVRRKI